MAFTATDQIFDGIESISFLAQQTEPPSPIDRLPVEIVGKIICYCALRPSAMPKDVLVLASISRAWRYTTHTTPRAWSNIRLNCEDDYDGTDRLPLDVARQWFSRAGACVKDVSIDGEAVVPGTHLLCELLDLLEPHVATLGFLRLDLHCTDSAAMTRLLAVVSRPMPALRYLILKGDCLPGRVMDQIDYTNKPVLYALYSNALGTAGHPPSCQMQLRRLAIETPRPDTLRSLSQTLTDAHSSRVVRGLHALLLISQSKDDERYEGALQADELEMIGVHGLLASSTRLFEWISAPKLTSLVLHTGYFTCKRPQAAEWARALARVAPPLLRALYLDGFEAQDGSMAALLARLPRLETLVLVRAQLSGALLDALSAPGYALGKRYVGWLCPRLMRVSTRGGRGPKHRVSREAMEAFTEARLAGYSQIASAGADSAQPIAELVAARHNGYALVGFDSTAPRARWSWNWVPAAGRHVFEDRDWWTTSFAEDLDF